MELKETEKKCLELLMKWGGDRVVAYTKLMEELQADVETCKGLIGKMKEIEAVTHDYPPGWLVSEEGAYFRIATHIETIWQEFLRQQKEKGSGAPRLKN
ncbi:MAG: hypothetical protein E3J30_12015 [Anaerolineales bacterium]|nr:MAG: hypothetical protein E3J30_12015 [Anaerolineales bacterium]